MIFGDFSGLFPTARGLFSVRPKWSDLVLSPRSLLALRLQEPAVNRKLELLRGVHTHGGSD